MELLAWMELSAGGTSSARRPSPHLAPPHPASSPLISPHLPSSPLISAAPALAALPLGRRDAVLHGYGVDALDEGLMLILGRSAQQADFPDVPLPAVRGFGAARMHVQGLQVALTPLAERTVRCAYVVHIEMHAPLPAPMVQFATQRVVGMIFHKLVKEARRIRQGPSASAHAARMARDAHIYEEWIAPRVHAALAALASGSRSADLAGAGAGAG